MKYTFSIVLFLFSTLLSAQKSDEIYLIVRGDDIGSFHAANVGCIESYTDGIMQSVELMPPCPWFYEAVEMLNQNPALDVGIHLTLTSEWSLYKWRPITHCPGLTDDDGNFYPMVWKNDNFPPNSSIMESDWKIDEIEQELRAQIELSLKHLPQASHISTHMGFSGLDDKIEAVVEKLAKEYDLYIEMDGVKRFPGWDREKSIDSRIDQFCENLENLTPGAYLFVEHPARDFHEMQPIGHTGSNDVAKSREMVTRVFTSDKVKKTIEEKNIKLISYDDYNKLINEGYQSIFNGKNLDGWKIHGTEKWYVEDGLLICESGPDEEYGYLSTEKFYDDFELVLEFRQQADGNSGVFFRSTFEGTKVSGWQVEVAPPNHDTGGIYESYGRGWLVQIPDEKEDILKMGEWNTMKIRVNEGHVTTWLNGHQMVDIKDEKIAEGKGAIALQIHSGGGIKVMWRDIMVKEL